LPSSTVRLSPNPPHIYLAPFDTENGKWLVGREGVDFVDFKKDFQTYFQRKLEEHLSKLAPTEPRWLDDLPDHGWMVAGEFVTVYQGSRFLRSAVGLGLGETTLQTNVYVYDLSVSKTQFVLAFRTGVPDPNKDTGAGSGAAPSGLTTGGEPVSTAFGIGSGLKLDSDRTAQRIADILSQYM
jgi:hypothetical protein